MMLHVKYLYGIKIDVRGAENFNIKEPYVIVSNHQSSLDLLGMAEGSAGRTSASLPLCVEVSAGPSRTVAGWKESCGMTLCKPDVMPIVFPGVYL